MERFRVGEGDCAWEKPYVSLAQVVERLLWHVVDRVTIILGRQSDVCHFYLTPVGVDRARSLCGSDW